MFERHPMDLRNLRANKPLGIQPSEAGHSHLLAGFEDRARRQARRLTNQIVGCFLALVAGLAAVILLSVRAERNDLLQHAQADGRNLSAAFAEEVTNTLDTVNATIDLLAAQVRAAPPSGVDLYTWAKDFPTIIRPALHCGFIGPDGVVVSTTLTPTPKLLDLSDREHFRIHVDGAYTGLYVSVPVRGRLSDRTTIQVSKRVTGADGRFLGVLMFALMPADLTMLHRSTYIGQHGVLSLVGTDGAVRARFTMEDRGGLNGVGAMIGSERGLSKLAPDEVTWHTHHSYVDQIERIFTYRRLAAYPLVVAVGFAMDEVTAPMRAHIPIVVAIGLLTVALLAGVTALLIREVWRRTHREIELARQHGELARAHAELSDERTKLTTANADLIASTERAEAANKTKSQFLAHMSHELRTPLHAIIGFAEIIKDSAGSVPDAHRFADYAQDIWSSGRHLLELINTILDIAKTESGTARLFERNIPVNEIIDSSLVSVRGQAQSRQLSIDVQVPEDLPLVRVDVTRMRQIVINLLSNAVKFTPVGGAITASARLEPSGWLVLAVTDTGIGMSEDEIAVALEPFGQVENSLARSFEGTGLGLPLARRLAELHDGELRIASARGKGTTVEVRLPPERVLHNTQANGLMARPA